ncbi:hypothetical protein BO78DRAFT_154170 [Aspergillus sclerotiicarbonarius CBS 121057]|uniref:Uncharacterized protein n=1 Tax=Aspergillus sclerotiicarbonarius (strain CBS 121057 / IBT 28362) TaxID=1448318 RepID=A0A319E6S2_ASPSB|nr:hypothetical protein BO78DRAFT_154170 [Aspergillus sclerotiicarbonarius CBS 121057]
MGSSETILLFLCFGHQLSIRQALVLHLNDLPMTGTGVVERACSCQAVILLVPLSLSIHDDGKKNNQIMIGLHFRRGKAGDSQRGEGGPDHETVGVPEVTPGLDDNTSSVDLPSYFLYDSGSRSILLVTAVLDLGSEQDRGPGDPLLTVDVQNISTRMRSFPCCLSSWRIRHNDQAVEPGFNLHPHIELLEMMGRGDGVGNGDGGIHGQTNQASWFLGYVP